MKRPEIEKLYNVVLEDIAKALEKTDATKATITNRIAADYAYGLDPAPTDKEDLRETANINAVLMNAAISLGQEVHEEERKGKIFCDITMNGVKYTCPKSKLTSVTPVQAPNPVQKPALDMDKLMYGDDEEDNTQPAPKSDNLIVNEQPLVIPSQTQNVNTYEESISVFDEDEEDSTNVVQPEEVAENTEKSTVEVVAPVHEAVEESANNELSVFDEDDETSVFDEDFDSVPFNETEVPVEAAPVAPEAPVEENTVEDIANNNISSLSVFDDDDEISEVPVEDTAEAPVEEVVKESIQEPANDVSDISEAPFEEDAFSDDEPTELSREEVPVVASTNDEPSEVFSDETPTQSEDILPFDEDDGEEVSESTIVEESPITEESTPVEEVETPVEEIPVAPIPAAPVSKAFTAGGEVDSLLEGKFLQTRKLRRELFVFDNYKLSLLKKGNVHTQEISATIAPLEPYNPQIPLEEQMIVPIVISVYIDNAYFGASSYQTIETGKNILIVDIADYRFMFRGGYRQTPDNKIRFVSQIMDASEAKDVTITPLQKKSYPEDGITQFATNGHLRFVQVVPDVRGPQEYVIHAIPFDMNSNDFIIVAHGPVFTDQLFCENRKGVNGQRLTAYIGSNNSNVNIDCNWYDTNEREFDYAEVTVKEN
jgi:hypothetical protein